VKVKLQAGETACADCGWYDSDSSFFTEVKGEQYCSLHIPSKGEDK